jgi:predicted nucleic acid-binding protein
MISAQNSAGTKVRSPRISISSFDLEEALRRFKPHKNRTLPPRRPDEELQWVADLEMSGGPLLIDTTVYIDQLQGRTPEAVDDFIEMRRCHHSAISLAELTHIFGRLDPAHPETSRTLKQAAIAFDHIPRHRILAPDTDVLGEAGILSGLLTRTEALNDDKRRRRLNDAILSLHARFLGAALVTRKVKDFDILDPIAPGTGIIYYRRKD